MPSVWMRSSASYCEGLGADSSEFPASVLPFPSVSAAAGRMAVSRYEREQKRIWSMPIEIDAESNLYVASEGAGDREAFARIFRETWFQIPSAFREPMIREWKRA
jgi:hypothetical protein